MQERFDPYLVTTVLPLLSFFLVALVDFQLGGEDKGIARRRE